MNVLIWIAWLVIGLVVVGAIGVGLMLLWDGRHQRHHMRADSEEWRNRWNPRK